MFFEVGSYKVHIYSRCVPYHNHRSAQPQFGEAERRSSPDAQLCTAVNRVQRKKLTITLHHRQTCLSFGTTFLSTVEPPYPCAGIRRFDGLLSFIFIESKPLVQQLGLALYFAACRSPAAQLRYRYVLYMTPLQKTQTIPLRWLYQSLSTILYRS